MSEAGLQLVSHRIIYYLTQSGLQINQSDSDQDDVKMVVPEISSNSFIKRQNIAGQKAVKGSANQNLPNFFEYYAWIKGSWVFCLDKGGESLFIQHNTHDTRAKIGEKPEYMPSGLAYSTEVYHRSNLNDRNQATMNNMGMGSMERGRIRQTTSTCPLG